MRGQGWLAQAPGHSTKRSAKLPRSVTTPAVSLVAVAVNAHAGRSVGAESLSSTRPRHTGLDGEDAPARFVDALFMVNDAGDLRIARSERCGT